MKKINREHHEIYLIAECYWGWRVGRVGNCPTRFWHIRRRRRITTCPPRFRKLLTALNCTYDLLCTNLENLYLLQNHFRVNHRWNFESIDLYLWKLPILFLWLFWIVPYHLYCWVHTMAWPWLPNFVQILSWSFIKKEKKQHTTWTVRLGPKYVKNISFCSF